MARKPHWKGDRYRDLGFGNERGLMAYFWYICFNYRPTQLPLPFFTIGDRSFCLPPVCPLAAGYYHTLTHTTRAGDDDLSRTGGGLI